MARALQRMTVDEFQAWSDARPDGERYELVDGEPRRLETPDVQHALMWAELAVELDRHIRPPCRVLGPVGFQLDLHNELIPDITVVCAARLPERLRQAAIVIEIFSPGTAEYDLNEKRLRYMQLPDLQEIWLVATDRRHILVWRKGEDGRWHGEDLFGEDTLVSPLLTSPVPLGPLFESVGL